MRYFANEIIRAFISWRFGISLCFSLGLLYLGMAYFYSPDPTPPPGYPLAYYNAYDAWRWAVNAGAFVLFAPLAAALPYADTFAQERAQKFSRYVLLRIKHQRYLITKVLVNGLSGGLALALPMTIFFGFTSLKYARMLPASSEMQHIFSEFFPGQEYVDTRCSGFLCEFYYSSTPDFYIFHRILLGFIFGLVFATLGMAISAFTNNRYIILSFPLIFRSILAFGVNFLGIPVFSPDYVLVTDGPGSMTTLTVFLPLGLIFTASLAIIALRIRKYTETPY